MYKKVEPFYEPENILDLLPEGRSEMSHAQRAFLCGLIKEKRPKKIIEVGVAAGATTCIILNCLEMIKNELHDTKMYSIDLLDFYYRDATKRTGYLLDHIPYTMKENHTLLTGKTLVEQIDVIASDRDIDFLILDTVHSLPGEILDFILCFPYLRKGATVVLHDIRLNHQDGEFQAYATKVLFDVVTAEKYLLWKEVIKPDAIAQFDSIGAFDINDDTSKYIMDLFSALTLTWSYLPDEHDLSTYREIISNNYDGEYMPMWDCAIEMQKKTYIEKYIIEDRKGIVQYADLKRKWKIAERVFIYGFGHKGRMYLQYARKMGFRVDGIVLSDFQPAIGDKVDLPPVYHLSQVSFPPEECCFINAGEKPDSIKEIDNNIRYAGYYKIM